MNLLPVFLLDPSAKKKNTIRVKMFLFLAHLRWCITCESSTFVIRSCVRSGSYRVSQKGRKSSKCCIETGRSHLNVTLHHSSSFLQSNCLDKASLRSALVALSPPDLQGMSSVIARPASSRGMLMELFGSLPPEAGGMDLFHLMSVWGPGGETRITGWRSFNWHEGAGGKKKKDTVQYLTH